MSASNNNGDAASNALWGAELQEVEPPEAYLLLRKLKMYAGSFRYWNISYSGQIPFLEAGGYLDQPYLASLELEACLNAEHRFQDEISSQRGK